MSTELIKIKDQLESLLISINDFLSANSKNEIIIYKDEFHKIRHLGIISSTNLNVFDFSNGKIFTLHNHHSSPYDQIHYQKLMSGDLDRIILRKRDSIWEKQGWSINFSLESEIETKLRDTYPSPE
jgi:hypothetical protein